MSQRCSPGVTGSHVFGVDQFADLQVRELLGDWVGPFLKLLTGYRE